MEKQREIKGWCFASMDGFTSRCDGDMDFWIDYPNPGRQDYGFEDFMAGVDCTIMSHCHYLNLQSQERWPLAGKPCHIVTENSFYTAPHHNIHYLFNRDGIESVISGVRELQQQPGGNIWLAGDSRLFTTLLERGMITEITVNIVPVLLGNGLPVFAPNGKESDWTLAHCQKCENGIIQVKYRVKKDSGLLVSSM